MPMSNIDRLITKMNRSPQNWRIEQLETIAKHFGIIIRKFSGGSHVVFDDPRCAELLSIPARRPIKPVYIQKFLNMIELLKNETH